MNSKGNTLLVAATGYGKTVVTSDIIGKLNAERTLVIQHRDELTNQNLYLLSIVRLLPLLNGKRSKRL